MGQANGRVLFVYYKINPLQEAAMLSLVTGFQRHVLKRWPDLSCELMQRPAASTESQPTWMEIYRHADTLSNQVIDGIARLAHDMHLPAPRFVEVFCLCSGSALVHALDK